MNSGQTRRSFLTRAAALAAGGMASRAGSTMAQTAESVAPLADGPVFIATWSFGRAATEVAASILEGEPLLDAVEEGIRVVESDVSGHSVGIGGTPNADGVVQLDACIMDGAGQRAGSVAALEDIAHPISVARRVMEETPHVMLVGEGARQFALQQGFSITDLLTENRRQRWEQWRRAQAPLPTLSESHDTIALLGLDDEGTLAGGCSTSGWGYKIPGRVGDSPIIGGGLYVDGSVGAAGATGTGENVMRYCGSYRVVDLMARGADPQTACTEAVEHIIHKDPLGTGADIHFIALDRQGRVGGAGTGSNFQYAVTTREGTQLIDAAVVGS